MELKVCCLAPDLQGLNPERLEQLIQDHLDQDILIFPEYLGQVCPMEPRLYPGRVVVYGSSQTQGQNQVVCAVDRTYMTGAKIRLTPWEQNLTPGQDLLCFDFKGVRCAVILCFDVEFPDLAAALKQAGVELLMVPAATEGAEGYYRVCRCASARAVELGCAVVTCHLIGQTQNELIDENVGAANLFLPSQSLFGPRAGTFAPPLDKGGQAVSFRVPVGLLREQKKLDRETNPALTGQPVRLGRATNPPGLAGKG